MVGLISLLIIKMTLIKCVTLKTTMENIPRVHVRHLEVLEPVGFRVEWDPVEMQDKNNPIIGFKIKLWETPCQIKTSYERVDNQLMKIEKSQRQKFNYTTVPQEMPVVYIVTADERTLTVTQDVEWDVWYHLRVIAFTKTAEGPMSQSYQFKLNSDDDNPRKDNRCNKITQIPVSIEEEYELE